MTPRDSAAICSKRINDSAQNLLRQFKPEYLEKYTYIMSEYRHSNITENDTFKKAFRGYYRMRFPTQEYVTAFFEVMEKQKGAALPDLFGIGTELYSISNRHELSFISKMLHTRFDDYPIYDLHIKNFFGITPPSGTITNKIEKSAEIIDYLATTYRELSNDSFLDSLIIEFDKRFENNISFVKKLDFLIWLYGKTTSKKNENKASVFCSKCRQPVDCGDSFCRHCGHHLENTI